MRFEAGASGGVLGVSLALSAVQWGMVRWQLRHCLLPHGRSRTYLDGCGGVCAEGSGQCIPSPWWWLLWAEVRVVQSELAALHTRRQDDMLRFLSNLSHEMNT
eukprot:RCo031519